MACKIDMDELAGIPLVHVAGDVDGSFTGALESALLSASRLGEYRVVADLMAVDYVESSPLGTLIKVDVELAERGGALAVLCCNERLWKLMRLSGLDARLHFFDDAEHAVAYLEAIPGGRTREA